MTANQIQLQVAQLPGFDAHVRQSAEAGVHTINGAFFGNNLFHDGAGSFGARACVFIEAYFFVAARDRYDLFERKGLSTEFKHESRSQNSGLRSQNPGYETSSQGSES